mmetsp:Transcript_37298/g.111719  ORF Transcript_37298/g.111719 Transcript_37298/m.111719 type:complete len:414 (-) Transcript_37298:732-1973(-)|eukprot:CAMPEP_0113567712 /NCGR_PEP_ID=MMETSP0015_2-20120614/23427_1 /TAXON_ID=2838 /ORGANISM="Odontella" /LENGTH=413 /DNA_ID=CAMNT_0000470135 /DNA_START=87 /DNA_END=1328 /DNA_ORIENTATION=+ /assembly_acc=CAM_ASM_000160
MSGVNDPKTAAGEEEQAAIATATDANADSEPSSNEEEQPPQDKPVAEVNKGGSTMSSGSFKLLLLILMVLQNSTTVLVGRHTRSSASKDDLYVVNHLIIVTELGKLTLAAIFEHFHTSGRLWHSVKENIIDRPMDALKIVIPSLLYLVQNSLLYVALSNLSAPLFQVTYQCKLLTTALVSVIMLNRRYSPKQWVCLSLLGIGVAIVVLGESDAQKKDKNAVQAAEAAQDEKPAQSLFVGLVAVSIACMSSALAGVYFEKVLKKTTTEAGGVARAPVSMWMRNIQMAFFSVCIGLIQYVNLNEEDKAKNFTHGFTNWVWVLVCLQAGGGMLVAAVIKYADNVLKGLATGVSVVFASLCSVLLFGTKLSFQFAFGAAVILGSVFFFSNDVPGKKKVEKESKGADKSVEMKNLLPK